MIAISTIVWIILVIVIAGLVWWLLYFLVNHPKVNLPEPFKTVANVILLVLAVFFLIGCLLHLVGINLIAFR